MNFLSSNKNNIRSTKSEVIAKVKVDNKSNNNENYINEEVESMRYNNYNINSMNHSNSNHMNNNVSNNINNNVNNNMNQHVMNNQNINHNNSLNFIIDDNNINNHNDIDKRSEIYYSNKAYDPQYLYNSNKLSSNIKITRNHTSAHRMISPRRESINLFSSKINRTSNIYRNYDDKLSYASLYASNNRKKNTLDKISIPESNDSFKTQTNSQIVEQSIELLKHLMNQDRRSISSVHESERKNKLMYKLIDNMKRYGDKNEPSHINNNNNNEEYNNSIDLYKKKIDMLNLKFLKLKNEYTHANNENIILKKQIKCMKDNYHILNPKSSTVSFSRDVSQPLQKDEHKDYHQHHLGTSNEFSKVKHNNDIHDVKINNKSMSHNHNNMLISSSLTSPLSGNTKNISNEAGNDYYSQILIDSLENNTTA
ncbi:hypothetical protein PFLG_02926 [Plasmodium falciparum RAJ116]|uniref:Uncharacterized protein n=1 Tax=Plasmodium falciparum RAJ116 TaxID=580058 RepID=A0A0L0CZP4_PLAFA|nr:hypothetical protein PFLG_02926 [Plasmodium falciparum RAJ116]